MNSATAKSQAEHTILVTGGTGYIGSHTVVELQAQGYQVVILDNLANSSEIVIQRIEEISGTRPVFVAGDMRDSALLKDVFAQYKISAVIHFAGLKAVGESVSEPLRYYANNVVGSLQLFREMAAADCKRLIFSSSATVYGDPQSVPIYENAPLTATNPYGHSKLMVEDILRDLSSADPQWQISLLRYFNPVAAHPSGRIGEDPTGPPNNLLPYIAQVSVGLRAQLTVHGNDYDTVDGTGVRDYIHVVDLARAHLAALEHPPQHDSCRAYNIGTGNGFSVLQMIKAFEHASGREIPYQIGPRREGDIATCYANPQRAEDELGWRATFDLPTMMQDHWRWQSNNPSGYQGSK